MPVLHSLSRLSLHRLTVRAGPRSAFQSLLSTFIVHSIACSAGSHSLRPSQTILNLVIMKYFTALPVMASVAAAQMNVMSLHSAMPAGPATHTVSIL